MYDDIPYGARVLPDRTLEHRIAYTCLLVVVTGLAVFAGLAAA